MLAEFQAYFLFCSLIFFSVSISEYAEPKVRMIGEKGMGNDLE
jgi:hypothetical protein